MIEQEIVTAAKPSSRARWKALLALAGVLVAASAAWWLFTPHLASNQPEELVGEIPQGGVITVPVGDDADPDAEPGYFQTSFHVRNTGPLPVTISNPRPADVAGSGTTHRVELSLSRSGSPPYEDELTVGSGEEVLVVVWLYGSGCSETGASENLTTVEDLIVRAQVGPIGRDTRVSAWVTLQVVAPDGSALPECG